MSDERRNYDVEMAELRKDITYIKEGVDENKKLNDTQHNELRELITEFVHEVRTEFKSLPNKYADKSVERFLKKIGWVFISTTITFSVLAFIFLVVKSGYTG